jgi:hypothetical protein
VLLAGVVGTIFASVFLVGTLRVTELPPDGGGRGYVRTFSPPTSPFEVLLDAGDGQAYATLALDPTLSHPEAFELGAPHAGYFARRPVVIYVLWAVSLGRRELQPSAFIGLSALFAGCFLAVCTRWLQVRYPQGDDRFALGLLLLPTVQTALFFSTDLIGQAFGMLGYLLWHDRRRFGWATACLVVAALTRETTMLYAAAAAVSTVWAERRASKHLGLLALVPGGYVAWDLVVRSRLGPPGGAHNFGPPLQGIIDAAPAWTDVDRAIAALGAVLVVLALVRCRQDDATWIALASVAAGLVLAAPVWGSWPNFSRVLLPAYVLPLLSLAGTRFGRRPPAEAAGAPAPP